MNWVYGGVLEGNNGTQYYKLTKLIGRAKERDKTKPKQKQFALTDRSGDKTVTRILCKHRDANSRFFDKNQLTNNRVITI
jgi:hypothetical protein